MNRRRPKKEKNLLSFIVVRFDAALEFDADGVAHSPREQGEGDLFTIIGARGQTRLGAFHDCYGFRSRFILL